MIWRATRTMWFRFLVVALVPERSERTTGTVVVQKVTSDGPVWTCEV